MKDAQDDCCYLWWLAKVGDKNHATLTVEPPTKFLLKLLKILP